MMPRRGFTLIELVVVMGAMAAVLAAAAMLVHFVLQLDAEVRQRTHVVVSLGRLAEQFRRDVHQARGEPVVASNHREAELHLPGGRIVKWRIDEQGRPIRTEQASGVADRSVGILPADRSVGILPADRNVGILPADRSVGILPADREDSFTLPKGTTAALEFQPQATARIVTIRIDSPGTGGPSLAIEALVSRDERLAAEEEKP